MKKTNIASTSLSAYKTKFTSFSEYKERYRQIQQVIVDILDPRIFASPRYNHSKRKIDWLVDVSQGNIVPYMDLPEQEQNLILIEIKKAISIISDKKHHPRPDTIPLDIEKWFEIPSVDHIYVLREETNNLIPILTMWGCLKDEIGSPEGVLMALMPSPEYHVKAKIIFPENKRDANGIKVKLISENGIEEEGVTMQNGVIAFGKLIANTSFQIIVEEFGIYFDFICDGRPLYELEINPQASVQILTQTPEGEKIEGLPIKFEFKYPNEPETFSETHKTNVDGLTSIEGELIGKSVIVSYYINEDWIEALSIDINQKKTEEIIIVGEKKEIYILDANKKPIPNLPLELSVNKELRTHTTDETGRIPFDKLNGGDEFFVKTKYNKRKFKTKPERVTIDKWRYEVLLKPNRWKYLLFLLPFLLLLIPVPNSLSIRVTSGVDELPLEASNASIVYYPQSDSAISIDTLTDVKGKASFHLGTELLFSKIFFSYPLGNLTVSNRPCYSDLRDSLVSFSKWRTNEIQLEPSLITSLDFVVKNKKSKHPISDATVEIEVEYHGREYIKKSYKSNFGGTITLDSVPTCANIRIRGSKRYHTPDSIAWPQWAKIEDLGRDLNKRTLLLESLLEEQTFYVKSTYNNRGIPGALIEAHIESGNDVIDSIKTVSSAEGKVTFPIPDNGTVFMRGELLGYHDSTYFKDISIIKSTNEEDSLTLWMRPETLPLTLTVIDTTNFNRIVDANIILKCNGVPSSSGRTDLRGEAYLAGILKTCQLELSVDHPDYYPKILKGLAQDFFNDSLRQFVYLRPKAPPGIVPRDCLSQSNNHHRQRAPTVEETYFLGKENGSFKFQFDTDAAPDKIEIFCEGKKIFQYEDASNGWLEEWIEFDSPYIRVKVTGSTKWFYNVLCPDPI